MQGIYSGVTTWELDTLAAETCAYMNTEHPHYARLAARISVSNLQRATSPSFAETVDELYTYVDPKTGRQAGYISDEVNGGGEEKARSAMVGGICCWVRRRGSAGVGGGRLSELVIGGDRIRGLEVHESLSPVRQYIVN